MAIHAQTDAHGKRVIEAEVVSEIPSPPQGSSTQDHPIPPVLGGMLLDLLDFFTAGPIGLFAGLAVGGVGAFLLGSLYKLPLRKKLLLALAAGLYCSFPGTAPIPLGTLVGAWMGFHDPKK